MNVVLQTDKLEDSEGNSRNRDNKYERSYDRHGKFGGDETKNDVNVVFNINADELEKIFRVGKTSREDNTDGSEESEEKYKVTDSEDNEINHRNEQRDDKSNRRGRKFKRSRGSRNLHTPCPQSKFTRSQCPK